MTMTKAQKSKLTKLRKKVLNEDGSYKTDADPDDLTELAKLVAMEEADAKAETPETDGADEGGESQKEPEASESENEAGADDEELEPEPEPEIDLTGLPEIVHPHVKAGCKYIGVDSDGVMILHNSEGYHRIASDGKQLDLLGDGLDKNYLRSLKK